MFYSDDADINPVTEVQGLTTIDEDAWNRIYNAIIKNKKTWDAQGVDYYVAVVPDKENIYREYLPDSVEIYNDYSRIDELMERMKQNGLENVLYLKSALLRTKAKNTVKFITNMAPTGIN